MADSDKNILITPNRGSTTDLPKIEFTGADPNTITLSVLDDATLSFSGTSGQLFSVSDSLTGTIFSVNDVSGIPSIEVDDDGTVRLAEFAGNLLVGTDVDAGDHKVQIKSDVSDHPLLIESAFSDKIKLKNTNTSISGNGIGFYNSADKMTGSVQTSWSSSFKYTELYQSFDTNADQVRRLRLKPGENLKAVYGSTEYDIWHSGIFANNSANWNTAYGWGNHASAGYLTSLPSHNHTIANVTGLQAALNGKVDDSQVLTNVPSGAVFTDTNTWRGIHDTPVNGATTTSISSNWAFDNVKTAVPTGAVFTDTVYSHPSSHPATMITTTDQFAYSNSSNVQDVLDDLDQAIANVNAKDPVITLTGDVTGSATFTNLGNATLTATVANNSHLHTIANVTGLQAALNGKVDDSQVLTNVPTGAVFTDTVYTLPEATATTRGGIEIFSNTDQTVAANAVSATAGRTYGIQLNSAGQAVVNVPWVDTNSNTWRPIHDSPVNGATTTSISSNWAFDNVKTAVPTGAVFTDTVYSHPSSHPATMITTTDEFAYSNSSNVQDVLDDLDQAIANVNAKDPILTLTGDVTGSATFTNLGNATLTATVANDSHTHDGRYYTESESNSLFMNTKRSAYDSNTFGTYIISKDDGGFTGTKPSGSHNGVGVISLHTHSGNYYSQLHLDTQQNQLWMRSANNTGSYGGFAEIWASNNDGSGSGLDADLLDGVQGSSFLRSDADDTASGQYNFTKVNDHAIKVGTIRGTAVGGQTGEFIQLYERVNIGGPSGWGNAATTAAPQYGLSTYGGAHLATHSGEVKIGRTITQSHGGLQILRNGGTPATSGYSVANGASIEIYSNNEPVLGFHNSGNSACSLYESAGDLYLTRWNGTATGSRLWHSNNDGSGSGLDADLLDGIQGSNYLRSDVVDTLCTSKTSGTLMARQGFSDFIGYNPSYGSYIGGGVSNASNYIYSGGYISKNGVHTLWHSGNDGSGSGLDADSVDGRHASQFTFDNFVDDAYIDFTVNGDANTYYPVTMYGSAGFGFQRYSFSRRYNWTAPSTWNTSSHKGGLTFTIEWCSDGAWGGNNKDLRVVQFHETYSTMVGGMALSVGGGGMRHLVVWLRGGGATYRLHAPNGKTASVDVRYSDTTASNGTVFSPRSYSSSTVISEIYTKYAVRGNSSLYDGNNKVWHAGNDGSGSGLDADLLDGNHASAFALASHSHSNYLPLSGGTVTSNLNVNGQIVVGNGQNSSYILMQDLNEGGRFIHCNSHRIGFLNNSNSWGSWCDDSGNWLSAGNVTAYASDERLKTNITTIANAVDKVKALKGVEYDWKDECESLGFIPTMKHETGVIAQNVQEVIPDAVMPAPFNEEYLTVDKEKIIPVLIEAIKEQQTQIDELQAQINILKGE